MAEHDGQGQYDLESVVRGHHIYKRVWDPYLDELLTVQPEAGNDHDRHAVSVLKDGEIVGHVPKEISKVFWYFLRRGGRVSCVISGRRKHGKGLEVPCVYKCVGSKKMLEKLQVLTANTDSTSTND